MFSVNNGNFKYLVVVVVTYSPIVYYHLFYSADRAKETFFSEVKEKHPGIPDAIYTFNSVKVVKEQSVHGENSWYGSILKDVIKKSLLA